MIRAFTMNLIFLAGIFAIVHAINDDMQYIVISRPTYGTNTDAKIVVREPIVLDFADLMGGEDLETFGSMTEIAQRLNSMFLIVSDQRDKHIAMEYALCKKMPHICATAPSIPILTRNPDIGALCRIRFANVYEAQSASDERSEVREAQSASSELHVWFGQDRFHQCAF